MEKGPETAGGFGRSTCGVVTKVRNQGETTECLMTRWRDPTEHEKGPFSRETQSVS